MQFNMVLEKYLKQMIIFCFFRKSFLDQYVDKYTYYAENNDSLMINPYSFYGKPSMWPRGFRYKDIEKNVDQKFYRMLGNRTKLNHLIFLFLLHLYIHIYYFIFYQNNIYIIK